eukprot:6176736-Pleurochrysis_carterae.AAC.3
MCSTRTKIPRSKAHLVNYCLTSTTNLGGEINCDGLPGACMTEDLACAEDLSRLENPTGNVVANHEIPWYLRGSRRQRV